MVFIEDEDFERLLLKISLLEKERDRAEGLLLRSVERSARKSQLTEGQLADICDIKTRLLYSSERNLEGDAATGADDVEVDPLADDDDDNDNDGNVGKVAFESPESNCSPVEQIVSEVEKLTSWWADGWKQLIVPPSEVSDNAGGRPATQMDVLRDEVKSKAADCERLRGEIQILESRLRVEQKFGEEKARKARADRDDARNATREALKKLALLEVKLQEVQERCAQSEKEMIAARSERAELAAEVSVLKAEVDKTAETVDFWKEKYLAERENRRKTHEQLQQIRGNIRVLCRIRPVLAKTAEKIATSTPIPGLIRLTKDRRTTDFEYNSCFGAESTQEEVFGEIAPLIMSFADGYNACIFAYGQTGSGKTFTMQGTREDPGIAPRVLRFLFRHAQQSAEAGVRRRIECSMLEVYNETVRDLLVERQAKDQPKFLDICALGPHQLGPDVERVPGLSRRTVSSAQEIEDLIAEGTANRATTATSMNEQSSRSHAVLSIRYHVEDDGGAPAGPPQVLHLVDLAGSERIAKSEVRGVHLREAQAINKSLSALGDVISSLQHKSAHVPYRNSKLTQLLQDSLSGNSKVLMVCNISPEESSAQETTSSLNFAKRANQVETGQARRVGHAAAVAAGGGGGGGHHHGGRGSKRTHHHNRAPLSNIGANNHQSDHRASE